MSRCTPKVTLLFQPSLSSHCQTQAIRFAGQFGIVTCMWKGDSITGALHIIVKWGHLAACVCSPTVYLRQRSMGLILSH